jgi:kynurenine formamidase
MFAPSPGVSIDVISRYDEKGPAWYWNTVRFGEHTGTHFDAPIHWVTGSGVPDNACDSIPAARFVGPACVIDVERDVAENPDFLLIPSRIEEWEAGHGPIPAGVQMPRPPRPVVALARYVARRHAGAGVGGTV